MINNVGSNLYAGGFGGDRGFLERDRGQYDESADVFAWGGGAVLLKREYLDAVGLFDERLFLYYEDTDLSWRGRLGGWRYVYEPHAVVRHRHALSSGVGSAVFRFHVERNRVLVLAKCAPARVAWRAGLGELRRTIRVNVRDLFVRPLRLRLPIRVEARHRRHVFFSYVSLLPGVLRDRWLMDRRVSRRSLMSWQVNK
ncbi:MAG: glycosyltransferase family 2 protein [Ilumatobacteraceae bacterium]